MTTVYLCPTYSCNLKCSHCSIKDQHVKTDLAAVVESAKTFSANTQFTLFGGEPLVLSSSDLKFLFDNIDITSVSTNLINMDNFALSLFKDKKVDIATSWNPGRFSAVQYQTWLAKLKSALDSHLYVTVLVTLTHDLFSSDIHEVLNDLDDLDCEFFDGIKFEPYIMSDEKLVAEADDWLCELYSSWKHSYKNIIADEYKDGNMHFCKNVWTVQPDGVIIHSCPATEKKQQLNNCFGCKYNKVCRPCVKQEVCTFFKKFYQKVTHYEHESR